MPVISYPPRGMRVRGIGPTLLTVSGLVAAFGVASCCGLPFVLATLGFSTAWLAGFALLSAPHRSFLLVAATVCLAGAAIFMWRQRTAVCATPGASCARVVVQGVTAIGLLVGVVLLYLGYTYA